MRGEGRRWEGVRSEDEQEKTKTHKQCNWGKVPKQHKTLKDCFESYALCEGLSHKLHCFTRTHHADRRCLSFTDEHDPGDTRLTIHELTGGSPSHHYLIVRVVQAIEVPCRNL